MNLLSDIIVIAGVYLVMFVSYRIGYQNGRRDNKVFKNETQTKALPNDRE